MSEGKSLRRRAHSRKVGDKRHTSHTPGKGLRLRAVRLGEGMPSIPKMEEEIIDMTNVLLGRADAPINHGTMSLMEVADSYYARAAEMTMLLQQAEREGTITRGSAHYKFRTGELRTFLEMAKKASELGSRRVTAEQMRLEAERYGRDSRDL